MTKSDSGYVRLDSKRRLSVGRYTELEPGEYFLVNVEYDGSLRLWPVPFPKANNGEH